MMKEDYFTKVDLALENQHGDLQSTTTGYVFVNFREHPVNRKENFEVGSLTLVVMPSQSIKSQGIPSSFKNLWPDDLDKVPKIYKGQMMSLDCYNQAIEWNKSFLIKVRQAFYKRLSDVTFKLRHPVRNKEDQELAFEIDELPGVYQHDNITLSMLFKVQNHSDVVAFKCQNLLKIEGHHKIRSYEDAMELTLAKLSEHCRSQNKVFEKLGKNMDQSKNQKLIVMKEIEAHQKFNS